MNQEPNESEHKEVRRIEQVEVDAGQTPSVGPVVEHDKRNGERGVSLKKGRRTGKKGRHNPKERQSQKHGDARRAKVQKERTSKHREDAVDAVIK